MAFLWGTLVICQQKEFKNFWQVEPRRVINSPGLPTRWNFQTFPVYLDWRAQARNSPSADSFGGCPWVKGGKILVLSHLMFLLAMSKNLWPKTSNILGACVRERKHPAQAADGPSWSSFTSLMSFFCIFPKCVIMTGEHGKKVLPRVTERVGANYELNRRKISLLKT